jgi:hypothetical protein
MAENFRREPIRSRSYLDGAKDQTCVFEIPDVCVRGPTVSCHLRDETFGMGQKADDTSSADGCPACHDAMDGRSIVLSREEWLFYAFRALQRTIRRRIEQGLLKLKLDRQTPASEHRSKPRKPPEQRQAIPQRKDPWPKGHRPIQSRNDLRRKERT